MRPLYGPKSQIVFQGACGSFNHFDGRHWRSWSNHRLPRSAQVPLQAQVPIHPFFDKAGNPAFNSFHAVTWQWSPETGWKRVAYEPVKGMSVGPPHIVPPSPPPGCSSPPPTSLVRDSADRSWWVAGDALYEGTSGHCRVILQGSVPQPFIDGRQVDRILLDAHGNVFLSPTLTTGRCFTRFWAV